MRLNVLALLVAVIGVLVWPAPGPWADSAVVVSLGADLAEAQRQEMLDYFGVKKATGSLRIIEVTNQEERAYLHGLVSEEVIGKRAISSAYCEILGPGEGAGRDPLYYLGYSLYVC
ncbi:MAG: DUF1002 domain-containing protein [Syntrophomonadaceae bacterium]|nr:DUF1002 domain-containing protein [Syntrophomonadaceae bacterium]